MSRSIAELSDSGQRPLRVRHAGSRGLKRGTPHALSSSWAAEMTSNHSSRLDGHLWAPTTSKKGLVPYSFSITMFLKKKNKHVGYIRLPTNVLSQHEGERKDYSIILHCSFRFESADSQRGAVKPGGAFQKGHKPKQNTSARRTGFPIADVLHYYLKQVSPAKYLWNTSDELWRYVNNS